jgi:hypothetical protein
MVVLAALVVVVVGLVKITQALHIAAEVVMAQYIFGLGKRN